MATSKETCAILTQQVTDPGGEIIAILTEAGDYILKSSADCSAPTAVVSVNGAGNFFAGQGMAQLESSSSRDGTAPGPAYDDHSEMTVSWSIHSQPTDSDITLSSGSSTTFSPMVAGTYKITLSITNTLDVVGTKVHTLQIPEFTSEPSADAGAPRSTVPNVKTTLNGTGSFDMDGDDLTYKWTKVSGPGTVTFVDDEIAQPSVQMDTHGTYVIKLTVTDEDNNTDEDTTTVLVENRLHVIQFVPDGPISFGTLAGQELDATKENAYMGRSIGKFVYNCVERRNPDPEELHHQSDLGTLTAQGLVTTSGTMSVPWRASDHFSQICCQPPKTLSLVSAGIRSFKINFATDNDYSVDGYDLQVSLDPAFPAAKIIHTEFIPTGTHTWYAKNACPVTLYYIRVRTKKTFTNPAHICYSAWSSMSLSTIDMADGIDIVYNIDNTGSMGGDIGTVANASNTIINTLDGITDNWRIGGVSYNDPGAAKVFDFTDSASSISSGVASMGAYGGGDYPEALYYGCGMALAYPFRANVAKMIISITDATGKATNGWDSASAIANASAKGVMLIGISTAGGGPLAELQVLAAGTGGVALDASGNLAGALTDLFTTHLVPNCGTDANDNPTGIVEGETSLTS
jgi:hypothetical protein